MPQWYGQQRRQRTEGNKELGANRRMVLTIFRKDRSRQVWADKVMPGVKPFCQIIQRLLVEEAWQQRYLETENRALWYQKALQQL